MLKMAGALALVALTVAGGAPTAEAQRYGDRFDRGHRGDRFDRFDRRGFRCVAQARRLGGDGPPIPGIGGRGFGPGACGEALSECRAELNFYRRRTGDAPFARCVIVDRGGRW